MLRLGLKFQQLFYPKIIIKIRNGHTIKAVHIALIITFEIPFRNQRLILGEKPLYGPLQYGSLYIPITEPLQDLSDSMILRTIAFTVNYIFRKDFPQL